VSFRTLTSGVLPPRGASTGRIIISLWFSGLFCVCLFGLMMEGGDVGGASSFDEFFPGELGFGDVF